MTVPASGAPMRERAGPWIASIHDDLTALFERLDAGTRFTEDRWDRAGGGGGVTRVMVDGATFEKAGINRSEVFGVLAPAAAARLGGIGVSQGETHFYATGVSLVIHPRSPMIPTVHLNVRYFELSDAHGHVTDAWFGGGTDLTPMYPHPEDPAHFHRALKTICDAHHPTFHPRFKAWCDEYFTNKHREGEARGCGGIFFDHMRADTDASGLALATHFGNGRLGAADLAAGVVGAVVKDPVHDLVAWREYLEVVVRDRAGWGEFYRECREVTA